MSVQDPRQSAQVQDDLAAADTQVRPAIARAHAGLPTPVILAGFGALGVGVFLWMAGHRADAQPRPERPAKVATVATTAQTTPQALAPVIPGPQFTENNSLPPTPAQVAAMSAEPLPPVPSVDVDQRRRAPTLVVDFGGAPALIKTSAETTPSTMMGKVAPAADIGLNPDERFADRLSADDAEPAKATAMRDLDAVIPQGAVIPAVMETAINSDLPGLARAMVTRDVKSFDGSNVLIPRGSRVIGQYRSGVALGASRIFVIWTRVIRPDGVSIQIASPAADPLGRGGLQGKVDRHFFSRFGGSILMSVLNAGVAAVGNARSTSQIYIGSASQAASMAGTVMKSDQVSPTIQTPQGAPVTIFVARDLDFSGVRR
ncbi:TrbI/VirB10 family protein [Caulobacter sp. RL271]|uniref:Type VI secretion protein n=1 Tax=Caulobacter segnis TaxID=88688 RepID=A0ABY4ZNV2_9CAUL|nr:TrbI/VirB10 family protein [Caulobacter segnis]USQ94225.1 type VI secretion protein [Caulobacter segnis]